MMIICSQYHCAPY